MIEKKKGEIVENELKERRSKIIRTLIEEERQERIERNKEELKELKSKLERLEKKTKKLRAYKPHYKPEFMEENSQTTIEELKYAKNILNNQDVEYLEVAIYNIKKPQEHIIKLLKEQVCSGILTPKQVGPICWFMSTFVAMFYSQRNRKVLLKASKRWDKQDELFTLLKDILENKYLMKNEKEDYEKFSDDTFYNILRLLFEKDSKSFPYNPKFNLGFKSEVYICKLYNLFVVVVWHNIFYSFFLQYHSMVFCIPS